MTRKTMAAALALIGVTMAACTAFAEEAKRTSHNWVRGWEIRTESSMVDGTRVCSATRGELHIFFVKAPQVSNRFAGNGSIGTWKDKYPGSDFVANLGGNIFTGEEFIMLSYDVIVALYSGGSAHFRYTTWPEGVFREFTVNIDKFNEIYTKCTGYIDNRPITKPHSSRRS